MTARAEILRTLGDRNEPAIGKWKIVNLDAVLIIDEVLLLQHIGTMCINLEVS